MNSKCPKCNDTGEIFLFSSATPCGCRKGQAVVERQSLSQLMATSEGRHEIAARMIQPLRRGCPRRETPPQPPELTATQVMAEAFAQPPTVADETEATAVRCSSEIDKLAKWFQTIAPKEIVEGSAVDNAIAYMERLRATARDGVATGTLTVTDCVVEPVPPTTTVTAVNCSVVQSNKEERASLVSFLLAACPDYLPLVEGIQTLVRGYEKELKEREDIPGECCLRASRHVAVLSEALRRTRWLLGPLDQPADLSQKESENFREKPRSNRECAVDGYFAKRRWTAV